MDIDTLLTYPQFSALKSIRPEHLDTPEVWLQVLMTQDLSRFKIGSYSKPILNLIEILSKQKLFNAAFGLAYYCMIVNKEIEELAFETILDSAPNFPTARQLYHRSVNMNPKVTGLCLFILVNRFLHRDFINVWQPLFQLLVQNKETPYHPVCIRKICHGLMNYNLTPMVHEVLHTTAYINHDHFELAQYAAWNGHYDLAFELCSHIESTEETNHVYQTICVNQFRHTHVINDDALMKITHLFIASRTYERLVVGLYDQKQFEVAARYLVQYRTMFGVEQYDRLVKHIGWLCGNISGILPTADESAAVSSAAEL